MKKLIPLLILTTTVLACKPSYEVSYKELSDELSEYRTTKLINLNTIKKSKNNYIQFENRNSVINISIDDFINYAQNRKNDSICTPKKTALKNVIEILNNSEGNHYFIEKEMTPELYRELGYSKSRKYKKNYIKPYGYQSLIDTVEKSRIEELRNWMVSELCINGKCLVLDKRDNEFADTIYYEIIDFRDGHGGESLKFADKKPFFNVEGYTDVAYPDFDCMTKEEIEEWENR